MEHKFKYSYPEIERLILPIVEGFIKYPKNTIRSVVEQVMPWEQYVEIVRDMEEYAKIRDQKIKAKSEDLPEETDGTELKNYAVYQFKISLNGVRPAVWRTIQVEANITLKRLAATILAVMGWENCHPHQFEIHDRFYGLPAEKLNEYDETMDEGEFRLCDIDPFGLNRFKFVYDYGDFWKHTIQLERMSQPKHDVKYPVCIKGARKCPPEDCGGPHGYENFRDILSQSKHPEYKKTVRWSGGNFDPEEFDIDSINSQLKDTIKKVEAAWEPMPNLVKPPFEVKPKMKEDPHPKILLAIGNDQTRKLLQKRLIKLWGGGYDLIYAEEIEDILALTKQHRPILIIIEDMCYCNGMGLEAVRDLKAINEQVKIIVLVWDQFDDDIEGMTDQGQVKVLVQGYKPQVLFDAIEDFLGAPKRLAPKQA
jgi:CheY-like chemotaxis protein